MWLASPHRRQYLDGVVFGPANREGKNALNMWKGFSVKPVAGSWGRLKEHMFENVCGRTDEYFDYLLKWKASGIQHPDKQGRVALVMQGDEGVGKGILARAYCRLFGQHALHISNAKHLTGNFNAHLQDCVVLFADEAFFAADRAHVGVLKALITEPTLTIERKRIDPVMTPNFLHVILASNNNWIVPAGLEARRFFVLIVSDKHRRDEAYFKKIIHELENGGYEAMLYELMNMDLSGFDVADFPNTDALGEQKKLSLSNEHKWFVDVLQRGYVYSSTEVGRWNAVVSTRLLYASYERYIEKIRNNYLIGREDFGKFMTGLKYDSARARALDCEVREGERLIELCIKTQLPRVSVRWPSICPAAL